MQPMCNSSQVFQGWATAVATCDGDITVEYFDEDGVSQGATLPGGWVPCVQGEDGATWTPTHVTLTYAGTTDIDFSDGQFMTLSINGNLTLTDSGLTAGREVWLRIKEIGGSVRTITKPSGWVVVGTAVPGTLAANKTLLLHLISFGTTDADVTVQSWVQA